MKRKLFLSVTIVFLTTLFMCLIGCNNKDNERKVDYQLQKQCGEDSEKFYKKNFNSSVVMYQSHYNKKLNKCFILVSDGQFDNLFYDVNENKTYGSFISSKGDHKTVYCNVLDKSCNSKEEWDKLVKPYMEE